MPNVELGYKILDLTEKYRHNLNMGAWVSGYRTDGAAARLADLQADECGTTACFAGWAVAATGHAVTPAGSVYDKNGDRVGHVPDVARELLGLDIDEAFTLFYDTTEDALPDTVARLFGPRPQDGPA